jgi:hypothetical protein
LAHDPVDFGRLLAIGYDEICWNSEYSAPQNANLSDGDVIFQPNIQFQGWVKATFSVTTPETALEIVKHPAEMGDADSPDPFCRWAEQNNA